MPRRRQRPLLVREEIGREMADKFCLWPNFHVITCCKSAAWGKRHAEDFFARKNPTAQPGLNPWTRVPEASMLITRPPKPLCVEVTRMLNSLKHFLYMFIIYVCTAHICLFSYLFIYYCVVLCCVAFISTSFLFRGMRLIWWTCETWYVCYVNACDTFLLTK
jgi:hypothetical protein